MGCLDGGEGGVGVGVNDVLLSDGVAGQPAARADCSSLVPSVRVRGTTLTPLGTSLRSPVHTPRKEVTNQPLTVVPECQN